MATQIKQLEPMTIYKDESRYNCQVGATQLQNGDIVVIFNEMRGRMHLDFDSIALVRSTDGGQCWGMESKLPVWPCTHHFGSDTPSIRQLRNGTLVVNFLMTTFVQQKGILADFGPQSERLESMRELDGVWLTQSTDNGQTWNAAYKANVAPLRWGQPVDEVLELPDGTLLMAAQGQMHARNYHLAHEPLRCFLLRSDNGGLDWEHWSTIAFDGAGIVSFSEPSLSRTADGTLVCMMRSMHQPRRRHQNLWVAYSTNNGESWSRPEPTNLWGYPADLTPLADGRMLATYGYRREPWGVRGCISADGKQWDIADEFVIRTGGIAPPAAVPNLYWHIGYPTTLQLHDGRLLTVDHVWTQEEPYIQYIVGVSYEVA